jgi:siroheme synthase
LFSLLRIEAGWVWLYGARPGEPDLASLLTLSAIAKADVVMSDALVRKKILLLARPDAEIIGAGKRADKPSPKQDMISRKKTPDDVPQVLNDLAQDLEESSEYLEEISQG